MGDDNNKATRMSEENNGLGQSVGVLQVADMALPSWLRTTSSMSSIQLRVTTECIRCHGRVVQIVPMDSPFLMHVACDTCMGRETEDAEPKETPLASPESSDIEGDIVAKVADTLEHASATDRSSEIVQLIEECLEKCADIIESADCKR